MNQYRSIEEITAEGSDLEALEALRQKVARTIDQSNSGRDIASLSRQLVGIMARIAEIKAENEEDPIKELLDRGSHAQVRDGRGRAIHGAHKSQEGEAGEL